MPTELLMHRLGITAACAFLVMALLWVAALVGLFHIRAVAVATVITTAMVVGVYLALRSGFNRRFKDPSLTRLQVLMAMSVLLAMTHLAHADRGFFLLLIPIAFVFAVFRLGARELFELSAITVFLALAESLAHALLLESVDALATDLLHVGGLALMLGTLSVVGGNLNDFRRHARLEREMAQITLRRMGDGVLTLDARGRVLYINALAESMCGWSNTRAAGHAVSEVLPAIVGGERLSWLGIYHEAAELRPGEFLSGRAEFTPANGRRVEIEYTFSLFGTGRDEMQAAVVVFRDVTERTRLVERLAFDATHDALTGLLNRRGFRAEVDRFIDDSHTNGRTHCVAVLDLDQFKVVNDVSGHAAGDQLLRLLADSMRGRLRQGDVIARLGGDEFGLVLVNIAGPQAVAVVDKLIAAIAEFRFTWKGRLFRVGASAGVAVLGRTREDAETSISRADGACYLAKYRGRNRVQLYEERDEDVRQQIQQMDWVSRLNQALEEGRFALFGQRIVPIQSDMGTDPHFEVLLRMRDLDGSLLEPMSFLPAAERFTVMNAIDRWVVRATLGALSQVYGAMRDRTRPVPHVSINLSGSTFTSPGLTREIIEAVRGTGFPADHLCFEVTETAAIANLAEATRFIVELRALGCKIALDDVGTGFSSFAYLRTLPIDYLKIDGSFVRSILGDAVDRAMVESIQRIAAALDIRTVAEYVEDVRQLPLLREIGVGYAQGVGLHRPEPLADLLHTLDAQNVLPFPARVEGALPPPARPLSR